MNLLKYLPFGRSHSRRSRARRWSDQPAQVERLEDRTLMSTFTVTSALDVVNPDDGVLTLREAIRAANATAEHDTIAFSIGTGGPQTIQLLSALPAIVSSLTIDGTSQPGFAGTPLIELDGSRAGYSGHGFYVAAHDCTIRGLIINRFRWDGIHLSGGGGHVIEGNYIGTDRTGTVGLGNWGQGIRINNSANNQVVGNVISANGANGIAVLYARSTGNSIRANHIGTDVSGTIRLGNTHRGIIIHSAAKNTIGGPAGGDGNLISGNAYDGILIAESTGTVVQKNRIGTDISGANPLGNGGDGIRLASNAKNNVIGGAGDAGNRIAFNGGNGVTIADSTSTGNSRRGTAVYSNNAVQVDPGPLGSLVNAPTLTAAEWDGTNLRLVGTFSGAANTTYFLDFFASTTSDPATFVGGQEFIGTVEVTTDASGNAAFDVMLAVPVSPGQVITATATGPTNATSLFSEAAVVVEVDRHPSQRARELVKQIRKLVDTGVLKQSHTAALVQMLDRAVRELDAGDGQQALVSLNVTSVRLGSLMRSGQLSLEEGLPLLDSLRNIISEIQRQMAEASDELADSGEVLASSKLRTKGPKALDAFFSGDQLDALLNQV